MMSAAAELERIPIFPLENVVLFPLVDVPLHIFEPRYRQMTRDALEGSQRIGMVVVQPDAARDMQGNPPIFEIGCVGDVVRAEELPGGRFNILLRGRDRFRIEREDDPDGERLYRVAHVEMLEETDDEKDRARVLSLRGEVHELMRQLLRLIAPDRVEVFDQQPFAQQSDAQFVNSLAQSISFDASEKQGLLEANSLRERYERLVGLMRFRLAELSGGGGPGPTTMQ